MQASMLASRGLSAVMLEKGKVKGRQQVLLNRHEQPESPKQPVILVKRWGYVLHKSRYVDLASQIDITVSIHRLRWAMDGKRLIAPLLVFDVSEFRLTLSDRVWHTHTHVALWHSWQVEAGGERRREGCPDWCSHGRNTVWDPATI